MAQVIENRQLAGKERCVELHVYALPSDHSVVVGKTVYGEPLTYGHHWHIGRLDVPVAEAYLDAVRIADERDISFVWVNDLHKLFPPNNRPSLDLLRSGLSPNLPARPAGDTPVKSKGVMSLVRTKTAKTSDP